MTERYDDKKAFCRFVPALLLFAAVQLGERTEKPQVETHTKHNKHAWDFFRQKGNRNEPKGNRLRPSPPRQAQAAGCCRSVALNLLADHQVAQIDAYDASESRDSQESAFFGELEIRLQDLQGYGITNKP